MKKLWNWGWSIYHKYEEVLSYLIFGFLAFVVNYVVYAVGIKAFSLNYQVSNMIAWVVAVIFAYWTNRTFVFKSKTKEITSILKEFASFVSARLATLILEIVILWLVVDVLSINDMFAKLVGQFVVIVTNYFLSKLWIFKKKK